jgi:hypothetical protein
MAQPLDLFTIGFGSEGLQKFEQELKENERQLDKYEKEVISLEKKLVELKNAERTNIKALVETDLALVEAKEKVDKFRAAIDTMQGRSEYQLLKLKKNFSNLVKTVGLLASVGVAVRRSLQFYEQGQQLDFLAQKTGIAVEKLQELGNASSRFGGTTEGSATSVENIRTNREEYKKAGISISEDPTQTLENVARKMETLKSDAAKWDLANSLGIDEGTTRLLIQGVERYREEMKRASKYKLYTKEDIERMRDYQQIQQDIRMGMSSIFGALSRLLLPAITAIGKAIRSVTDWLAEHEGMVKIAGVFIAIAAAIGAVTLAVTLLNGAIAFLMANPIVAVIVAIIAAITLLIAIIQDFITFLQGGESIIGDILQKCGVNVEELRNNILSFFQNIQDGVSSVIEWLKSLGGWFVQLAQKAKAMWDSIPEPLKKLISLGNPITASYTAVTTGKEVIEKYNKNPTNSVPIGAQGNYYNAQSQNQNVTNNSKKTANTRNQNINANITINTQATDPKAVAQETADSITSIDTGQIV